MPPLPRARCLECRRLVPVRNNGTLREHRTGRSSELPICEWSGKKPEEEEG